VGKRRPLVKQSAEVVEGVDSGIMPIVPEELDGIAADGNCTNSTNRLLAKNRQTVGGIIGRVRRCVLAGGTGANTPEFCVRGQ